MTNDVIVTGGLGFIGSEFIRSLTQYHSLPFRSLTVVDRLSETRQKALLERVSSGFHGVPDRLVEASQAASLDWSFGQADFITLVNFGFTSHTVGTGLPDYQAGVDNAVDLVTALRADNPHARLRVVNISSAAVYGRDAHDPDESVVRPTNYYGLSKALLERRLLWLAERMRDVQVVNLRLFNVYGLTEDLKYEAKPRTSSFPYTLVARLWDYHRVDNKHMEIWRPEAARDFVPVELVVDAIVKTIQLMTTRQTSCRSFGVGLGQQVSLLRCAELLREVVGEWDNARLTADADSFIEAIPGDPPFAVAGGYQADTMCNRDVLDQVYLDMCGDRVTAPSSEDLLREFFRDFLTQRLGEPARKEDS